MSSPETFHTYTAMRAGKPLLSPKKHPIEVPNSTLAEAISREWEGVSGFNSKTMPMSAMAFAAVDIIPEHHDRMIEALIAYAETDLLIYRSETPELRTRQQIAWDPVLAWARGRFDCEILETEGIMPREQPQETLLRFQNVLKSLSPFAISALTVLTQSLGSLILALAVKERWLEGAQAFTLSRVDEDFQAEQWGEDSVTIARALELKRDVLAAERFLTML